MKRTAAVTLVATALLLFIPARAQVDAEDLRRLNGTVEALTEGQESLRRQIQELREQLERVRSENAQLRVELAGQRDQVTRDQLKQVVDQLQEVDRRRAADAEYVKTQLADIAREASKAVAAAAKEPPRTRPGTRPGDSVSSQGPSSELRLPEYMYEHVVRPGETVSTIIAAYNQAKGLKVTLAHVLAANPELKDPKRLRAGQKLNIPEVR
ncbi:MAG: LysM peptidoglycan-binding domain-containing protein [Verrucomicrobiae bacterium]|nr:LysM peptidoglycan-binding domain-containing protein [Verrucomicrobiae bacterium]